MATKIVPNGWSSTAEPSHGTGRTNEWFLEEAPVAGSKLTTSPRNMILEKFVQVPGLGPASDIVRYLCDFEPDSLFDRKPVQLDECWLGVVGPGRYRHYSSEFVLNVLQLLNIGPWSIKQQGVAVVQPRCNQSMSDCFGGLKRHRFSDVAQSMDVKVTRFYHGVDVRSHWKSWVKLNSENLDWSVVFDVAAGQVQFAILPMLRIGSWVSKVEERDYRTT